MTKLLTKSVERRDLTTISSVSSEHLLNVVALLATANQSEEQQSVCGAQNIAKEETNQNPKNYANDNIYSNWLVPAGDGETYQTHATSIGYEATGLAAPRNDVGA